MKAIKTAILAAALAALFLPASASAEECVITGDFHANITEDGLFVSRMISYRLISAQFEGHPLPMPKKVSPGKNVRVVKNRYGEDVCVFANKVRAEFLAEDKDYNRKYILPDEFSAICVCM